MTFRNFPSRPIAFSLLVLACLPGCRSATDALSAKTTLTLTSSSITNGQVVRTITCDGANTSPDLAWSALPPATRSLALLFTDPDAPGVTFTHWTLFNIPAEARSLPAALPKTAQLSDGSRQGHNDFDATGYGGPCPPGHSPHRYVFNLYAVDILLDLPPGATRQQIEEALKGHVLASGQLTGRYSH
jgi:Raf kinase inhibitor-like YbhB/YbcL family protein